MAKYLKKFQSHADYAAYSADTTAFIKPNVSICITEGDVHYTELGCEESTVYEVIGTPTYPSTIDGDATSFEITVNYRRTDTDEKCKETVTDGTDTVTVECGQNPSTSSTRTVSGTVTWNGNEIEYSVTQSKFEAKVTAKFNVTDTSNPTRIASGTSSFTKIVIDGVEQPSVTSGYTFGTTGEHIVKYFLKNTSIGEATFRFCGKLAHIDIPDSVTNIGQNAFYFCTGLTSITIPDSVTSIGGGAFLNCIGLTSVTIGSGVTSISAGIFQNCSGLTSIGPIGSGASVEIPSGVTSIGGKAFQYCYGLTSIDIPDSVTSIGAQAFDVCSGLTSITVEATTPPTLDGNALEDTNNCPIYVPYESVDTYKAARCWSTYASRIQAIP